MRSTWIFLGIFILTTIGFVIFFTRDAVPTLFAHRAVLASLGTKQKEKLPRLNIKQVIQRLYSQRGVYVPTDHILAWNASDGSSFEQDREFQRLFPDACPPGKLVVILPLRFYFPFVGVKVVERCFLLIQ